MAERPLVGTALRGGALAVLCIAMFEVPASYLASRGWSPWLSLAAGLLTFPLLSLVWHAVAERERKRTTAARAAKGVVARAASTRGWERWLLRSAVVGIVVVGALVALAGPGRILRGLRHHALWFVPESSARLTASSKTFDVLPPDTSGFVWVRLDAEVRAALGELLPASGDLSRVIASDFVVAAGPRGMVLAERGDSQAIAVVTELFSEIQGIAKQYAPGIAMPSSTRAESADGTRYLVSSEWKDQIAKGRPTALLSLVERAPASASIVFAALAPDPSGERGELGTLLPNAKDVGAMVGYVQAHRGRLELVVAVDFTSAGGARAGLSDAKQSLAALEGNACWKRHGRAEVSTHESTATAAVPGRVAMAELRASISLADLESLVRCLDKE